MRFTLFSNVSKEDIFRLHFSVLLFADSIRYFFFWKLVIYSKHTRTILFQLIHTVLLFLAHKNSEWYIYYSIVFSLLYLVTLIIIIHIKTPGNTRPYNFFKFQIKKLKKKKKEKNLEFLFGFCVLWVFFFF